jgi:hypothetical protein
MYTLVNLTEPGRDGVAGTADDAPIQAYSLTSGSASTVTVNDDRLAQHYNGMEISVTKRYSKGWTALIGYDYGKTRQDLVALNNPNNVNVNAGGVSGGRRHIFKGSASYLLPWYGILVGTEFQLQSGLPITRTWTPPTCGGTPGNCLNQNQSLNVEPRGSVELEPIRVLNLRVGRVFRVGKHMLDASIDGFNIFNSNAVYNVNTNSTTRLVRYGGDPNQPLTTIPNFLSPNQVLGPRIARFNLTWSFGQ